MAQQKQSARQVTDAAAAALMQPKIDELLKGDPLKPVARKAHTKPDGFIGDKPGFFRGARIKK